MSTIRHLAVDLRAGLVGLVLAASMSACAGGSAGEAEAPQETPSVTIPEATVPGVGAVAATSPPTTEAPSATAAPATTIPIPTTVPLPQPAMLPLDDEAVEPIVPFGSIAIPAIGIDRPLFEGIRLPTFDLGPGHWPGTAMPGQVGNMVLGGHRTESRADFGDLDLLAPGNEVIITDTTGSSFTYLVESTEIIDPFAAKIVYQTPERTATLFACHPKGTTDRRIVVHLTLAA